MPSKEKIEALYKRYLNNDISREELEEFFEMLPENELTLSSLMDGTWEEMFDERAKVVPMYKYWYRVAVASVVILLISVGSYFYFNRTLRQTHDNVVKNDVAPGGNKAILTLANGKQIILDSAHNGTITQQGDTKVIKLDSGQLAYSGNGNEILYNTITTPKGGQYQIVLADGSKVWLNAASSLHFPTSFSKDRNVELTGEGYFEVVHNASKPFTVSVNGMNVEDLGTHFNINAYNDENIIKTTLLEGSVKVSTVRSPQSTVLRQGQQAVISASGQLSTVNANIDEAVAWKNGVFQFEGADIKTVMRQIARWYDVDVVYQGNVDQHFRGTISRNVEASKVFTMLELTKAVHFEIEGKKIIVKP